MPSQSFSPTSVRLTSISSIPRGSTWKIPFCCPRDVDQGRRNAATVRPPARKAPAALASTASSTPAEIHDGAPKSDSWPPASGSVIWNTRSPNSALRQGADPQTRHQLPDRRAIGRGILPSGAQHLRDRRAPRVHGRTDHRDRGKYNQLATAANRTNVWGKEFPVGLKGVPASRGLNPSILIERLAPLGRFFGDPNLVLDQKRIDCAVELIARRTNSTFASPCVRRPSAPVARTAIAPASSST